MSNSHSTTREIRIVGSRGNYTVIPKVTHLELGWIGAFKNDTKDCDEVNIQFCDDKLFGPQTPRVKRGKSEPLHVNSGAERQKDYYFTTFCEGEFARAGSMPIIIIDK